MTRGSHPGSTGRDRTSPDSGTFPVDLYTVGHSTRELQSFIDLLQTWSIDLLLDIRSIPYSGYNPQFNREPLSAALAPAAIAYKHDPRLAGPAPDRETMKAARSCAERSVGYDAWLETDEAGTGISDLMRAIDSGERIAMMCGEIRPDRCHRFRLSSRLAIEHGRSVRHIASASEWTDHPPTLW